MPRTTLNSELVTTLTLANSRLCKRIDCQLGIHGLSFTEFMIMRHLNEAPKNTLQRIELANLVGITASGITRLLLPMQKNNIVRKEAHPRDARMSLVRLSKTGKQLFKDAEVSFLQQSESLLENLTDNQVENIIQLLKKIA